MSKKVYAVKIGRKTGIFYNWDECNKQVKGFSGAIYKSFKNINDAKEYLGINENKNTIVNKEIKNTTEHSTKDRVFSTDIYIDGKINNNTREIELSIIIIDKGEMLHKEMFIISDEIDIGYLDASLEIYAAIESMKYCLINHIYEFNLYYTYDEVYNWCTRHWKHTCDISKRYKLYYDYVSNYLTINFKKVDRHKGNTYEYALDICNKTLSNL